MSVTISHLYPAVFTVDYYQY